MATIDTLYKGHLYLCEICSTWEKLVEAKYRVTINNKVSYICGRHPKFAEHRSTTNDD